MEAIKPFDNIVSSRKIQGGNRVLMFAKAISMSAIG